MINIVLVEPEIPQNTGNIARTCAVTGSVLHLVGPLGFRIDDAKLKRAGLDYWHMLDIRHYADFAEYMAKNPGVPRFYATTHGKLCYADAVYPDGCHILFGKETAGLPHRLISENYDRAVRIPQISEARSLNLSNSAAIIVYEALRQQGFPGMKICGEEAGTAE